MSTAVVTGSGGLIGAQAARRLHDVGFEVVGIDNDMRRVFFGDAASTRPMSKRLVRELPRYTHHSIDIREREGIERLFSSVRGSLDVVVHTAAQPSHDWAGRDPFTDFGINAYGTLVLLEAVRRHAPDATFVFTSTNKVYGDTPNSLPLEELETRYELPPTHRWHGGIDESMSIDQSTHSLFGVSKAAADLLVQEYARYFGITTVTFRGGCLTGPGHAGAELHGFLAYLVRCAATGTPYTVYGYKGKQVRDNIHSADLISAFETVIHAPRAGAVYNIGGGREVNCSMLEAISLTEEVVGRPLRWNYDDRNRIGDHIWWIGDLTAFKRDYPDWEMRYDLTAIITEIYEENRAGWLAESRHAAS